MTQVERIEAYRRFGAARAGAQIATDISYDPSDSTIIVSSGTGRLAEHMESEQSDAIIPVQIPLVNFPITGWELDVWSCFSAGSTTFSTVNVIAAGDLKSNWHSSALSDLAMP